MDFNQMIQNFQAEMFVYGITPPQQIISDGQLHRFYVQGDKQGSKNGWYVLFINTISYGIFGNWKEDGAYKWYSQKYESIGFQERQIIQQQIAATKLQRAIIRKREHEEAAQEAHHIYCGARKPHLNFPYLVRKMIKPFYARQYRNCLILPVIDLSKKIWGLQYIAANGQKWFLSNTAKQGHFIPIQSKLTEKSKKILICEGFATGASLAECYPDACVVAACDANNLKPVAVNIRQYTSQAELIICADDDQLNPDNPGINKGKKAAIAANASFIKPQWPLGTPEKLTDFNDLFCWLSSQEIAT